MDCLNTFSRVGINIVQSATGLVTQAWWGSGLLGGSVNCTWFTKNPPRFGKSSNHPLIGIQPLWSLELTTHICPDFRNLNSLEPTAPTCSTTFSDCPIPEGKEGNRRKCQLGKTQFAPSPPKPFFNQWELVEVFHRAVTFLLYFVPKPSNWSQSGPVLHH